MNLLGNMFADKVGCDEIVSFISSSIQGMPASSLAHALPILAESNLKNKYDLINGYCRSDNRAIAEIANDLLTDRK